MKMKSVTQLASNFNGVFIEVLARIKRRCDLKPKSPMLKSENDEMAKLRKTTSFIKQKNYNEFCKNPLIAQISNANESISKFLCATNATG